MYTTHEPAGDRGEILDHSYSGTNYISVKFTNTQAVADALGIREKNNLHDYYYQVHQHSSRC
jgi:hypothetical protein